MTHPLNMFEGNSLRPEVKKQFVDALRSGQYKQGKYGLNIKGCFCPIGVLSDLAVKAGVARWADYPYREDRKGIIVEGNIETCVLVPHIGEWAGTTTKLGDIRFGPGHDDTLMSLNDDLNYTFEQIADIVEERL